MVIIKVVDIIKMKLIFKEKNSWFSIKNKVDRI